MAKLTTSEEISRRLRECYDPEYALGWGRMRHFLDPVHGWMTEYEWLPKPQPKKKEVKTWQAKP